MSLVRSGSPLSDDSLLPRPIGGIFALAGIILFTGLSVLHPPTFNPNAIGEAMAEIAATPYWASIHWGLAVGSTLLGLGLLSLHQLIKQIARSSYTYLATGAMIISTTLWSLIFIAEAAGSTNLARAYLQVAGATQDPATTAMMHVVTFLWRAVLAVGYGAAFLLGLAVLFWGVDIRQTRLFPPWTAWLGMIAGALVAITQPLGWIFPHTAIWLLGPPAALLAIWVLAIGWLLWKG